MYGAFDVVLYFVIIQLFWLLINLLLILSVLNTFSSIRKNENDLEMRIFRNTKQSRLSRLDCWIFLRISL